jgi:hypothetical protein
VIKPSENNHSSPAANSLAE